MPANLKGGFNKLQKMCGDKYQYIKNGCIHTDSEVRIPIVNTVVKNTPVRTVVRSAPVRTVVQIPVVRTTCLMKSSNETTKKFK